MMRHARWFPVVAIGVFTVLFFWRYLIAREISIPYDLQTYHFPLITHIVNALRDGVVPLWDPFAYSGYAFFADITTSMFYPPQFALYAVALAAGQLSYLMVEWFQAAHFALLGVTMYALLRDMQLGRAASLVGAITSAFGGFMSAQMQHFSWYAVVAWMPLLLLCIRRGLRDGGPWPAVVFALVTALTILSGYPPGVAVFLPMLLTAVLAGIVEGWRQRPLRVALARVALLAVAGALGAGLSGLQLLPYMEAQPSSTLTSAGSGLDLRMMATIVLPDFWGHLSDGVGVRGTNHTTNYVYGGALLALFVSALAAGLWHRRFEQDRPHAASIPRMPVDVLFWVANGGFAFACMFGEPMRVSTLFTSIPSVGPLFRPMLFGMVFAVCVGALSAFGAHCLFDLLRNPGPRAARLAALLAAPQFVISAICMAILATRGDLLASSARQLAWSSLAFMAAGAGVIGLFSLRGNRMLRWLAPAVIVACVFADAYAHNSAKSFNAANVGPEYNIGPTYVDAGKVPVISFLQRNIGDGRVALDHAALGGSFTNASRNWQLRFIGGENPVANQEYLALFSAFESPSQRVRQIFRRTPGWTEKSLPALDMLGVEFALTTTSADLGRRLETAGWRRVFDQFFRVYQNPNALPPAYFATQRVMPGTLDDVRQALPDMLRSDRRAAAVAPGDACAHASGASAGGTAQIVETGYNTLVVRAASESGGLLVLSDTYYPGWQANSGGVAIPVVRANLALRGVCLPPGEHTVRLVFNPPSFASGAAVSLASLVALIALAGVASLVHTRAGRVQAEVGASAAQATAHIAMPGRRRLALRLAAAGLLVALVGVSVAARVVNPDTFLDLDPQPDSVEYVFAARMLSEQGVFSLRVNDQTVPSTYGWGFPLLLAPLFALPGTDYTDGQIVVLLCSAIAIVLVFIAARALFGAWPALVAAACLATSSIDVFLSGYILSEVPATMMTCAALAAAILGARRWAARSAASALTLFAASGFALGYACWARLPTVVILPAFVTLVAAASARRDASGRLRFDWQPASAFAAALAVMAVPVLAYNTTTFGSPFRTGYNFWLDARYGDFNRVFAVNRLDQRLDEALVFASGLIGAPVGTFASRERTLAFAPFLVLAWAFLAASVARAAAMRRQLPQPRDTAAGNGRDGRTSVAFAIAALVAIIVNYGTFAVYSARPDLRFFHILVPWFAVACAGGFRQIIEWVAVRAGSAASATGIVRRVAAVLVIGAIVALFGTDNNRSVQAPLRHAHVQTFTARTEQNAVLITDEIEPVYFAAFQNRASARSIAFLEKPTLRTSGSFTVASARDNPEFIKTLIADGRPVYFIGRWDGTLDAFSALEPLKSFSLTPAFETAVNPYVTSRVYRVSSPVRP